jgi:bifunctional non-homologous end joining protein LigD
VSSLLDGLDEQVRSRLARGDPPKGSDVMRATLTDDRFDDPDWIFERKLDGIRCLAVRDGARVRLFSRNDLPLNGRYPELAQALEGQACQRFAIDGEVVAFDGAQTSFTRLAQRAQHPVPVFFYVFDVLWLDGYDLRVLDLLERKRVLRRTLAFTAGVRLTPYRRQTGRAYFEAACHKGWEGVVAKRAASSYASTRSRDWLKFKCGRGQEFVIGGYTDPRGSRTHFGALLLGYYDAQGELEYAGKVGTGFDTDTLGELGALLTPLAQVDCPFADAASIRERGVHWVKPTLVAQIGFAEWTGHARLRHPRFLGLRDDKAAQAVEREG